MINNEEKLSEFLSHLRTADWIAIDTEADSLHAYPEKLCVLQLSVASRDELIDPLSAIDLAPLWPVLERHELIFHGADYDLRLLRRGFGFVPHQIFDTMLAARLLGCPEFGLSSLVASKLGIKLEKGPQKMDWARRPLTERMEQYARNDTRYLHPLAEMLSSELKSRDRLEWHRESCARLIRDASRDRKMDPETVWRIRGSDRLPARALAILRELWHWREAEAIAANKPPFFILSHEHLISAAARAAHGDGDPHPPPRLPPKRKATFEEALQRALAQPPSQYPRLREHSGRRLTRAQQNRVEELRKHRDHIARDLALDPALIASRATLVALATTDPDQIPELMNWQRHLLLESKKSR